MKSFEDLDCWQRATALRRRLRKLVEKFPDSEKYRLVDQIIRASRSVTANIAEGYGRFHFQQNAQFCRLSRGSLYELIDHIIVGNDDGHLTRTEMYSLRQDIETCLAVLNGYIAYLLRAKRNSQHSSDEEPPDN